MAASMAIRQQEMVNRYRQPQTDMQNRREKGFDRATPQFGKTVERGEANTLAFLPAPKTVKMDPLDFLAAVLQRVQVALVRFWKQPELQARQLEKQAPTRNWIA